MAYNLITNNVYLTGVDMKAIKTIISLFLLGVIALNMSGCSRGATLVTGVKRTAIDVTQVRVYHTAPNNYDVIGTVNSSGFGGFSQQGNLDSALEELKVQAAKVGANGVILTNTGEVESVGGGTFISNGYGGGTFIANRSSRQTISGIAIHTK
jgi:hypothetical protein